MEKRKSYEKILTECSYCSYPLGAAFGAVSSADAFIYGLYNNTAPGEITQLGDGINLCYEHQCNSVFVDDNSAYIVSQDGPMYVVAKNGKLYPQNRPTQESCGAEMRGGAKALQIWHAVMGTDW